MHNLQRIFVTGATGFIGSRLTRQLVESGYTVGVIIRDGSDPIKIGDLLNKITVFRGDIRNGNEVSEIIAGFSPDCIIHLVTYYAVEHVPAEVEVMVDTNVKGTINLLDAARQHGVKLFVNTSTSAVYEQKDRKLSETDPVHPQNLYAVTKYQAETASEFYALNYGVDAISLRVFPPYGPGDHDRRLIPFIIKSFLDGKSPALTTGLQKWDYLYVDDLVNAFLAVLCNYPFANHYEVVNVGTGSPVSIRDLVITVMKKMGREFPLEWGAVPHRKNEVWFNSADISKARNYLGWIPATGLDEGLERTIAWCRKK
jgi:nucleoside-diphosphate-sugar epimerase